MAPRVAFAKALVQNVPRSHQWHQHFPTDTRQCQVTDMAALTSMRKSAQEWHDAGNRPVRLEDIDNV
eukprot:10004910-Karenia_brevis.AAC.1